MQEDYSYSKFTLEFEDSILEQKYREHILGQSRRFSRISWLSVVFLAVVFGFLDKSFFAESYDTITIGRIIFIGVTSVFTLMLFLPKLEKFIYLNSSMFIINLGVFCVFLLVQSDNTTFSPYFIGLFYVFTGVFVTMGLGFRYTTWAMIFYLVIFESAVLVTPSISTDIAIAYNFFFISLLTIFGFIAYYIEHISRRNYVISAQLNDSLSQVEKLDGLLPICSHCKKIRDDKGYWNQVEEYIRNRSDAQFSHGICPECLPVHYPNFTKPKDKS